MPATVAPAAAIAVVTPVAVPLIYGASFRGSVAVVWCMLPGLVAFSAGRMAQTYLAATDRLRPVIRASTAGVAAGLVCLVVLGGFRLAGGSARRARDGYLDRVRAAAAPVAGRVLIVDRALSPRRVFELMCAADVAGSVPSADQRSSSVLEAALAGCYLLLSDIAPYREMVRDGLSAELLAEPIGASLAGALLRARR